MKHLITIILLLAAMPIWAQNAVDLDSASTEQSLQSRINDRQTIVIIQFQAFAVKTNHNEIILLLIVIQADTDRRNKKRILLDILLLKVNFL